MTPTTLMVPVTEIREQKMLDAILAGFQDNPSLVCESQQATFNGCLNALAEHEDFPKLMASSAQDDFWFRDDDWRARYRPYNVKAGILTIPVKGVLMHDFAWSFGSWATGYEYILKAFERGQADPQVRGIAFLIHSPGGDVAGCFDAVDKMFAAKGNKPVRAFAHEYAYSAAYAIASLADKIVVSRTGGVGSIGVVTAHVDYSKRMEQDGIKVTFIKFGAHKTDGNPYEPLGEDAQARIQARIDALGEVFVATVARNRKLEGDAVRKTEALTYTATEAISIGLADMVGPLDDAVAAFAADLETAHHQGDEQMTKENSAAPDQAAIDAARASGHAEGVKAGAVQERARISAILESDVALMRPAAARMLAFDTDKESEAAVAALAKLPEEGAAAATSTSTPASGAAAANFQKHVEAGAPGLGGNEGQAPTESRAARVLRLSGMGKN